MALEEGIWENRMEQKRYAWMAFSAICIMIIVSTGLQWSCMNLYAAPVTEDLGMSRTQFMFSLSIPSIISAAVSLLAFGAIESRFGMRRMLLLGGMLDALAFLCWSCMNSLVMLYAGAALYGFGVCLVGYNSVSAGVNRWFKQRMGSLVGVANALCNAAGIVFALVVATAIASIGWRTSFLVSAAVTAASTVACVALYKGNPEDVGVRAMFDDAGADTLREGGEGPAALGEGVPFRQALHTPRLWFMAFAFFLLGATTYALMSTTPLFAVDAGFSDVQGQAVSASLLACGLMLIPLGMVCDRFGTRWGLALCCAFTAAAALLLCLPHPAFSVLVSAAVCTGAGYSACSTAVGVGVKEAFGDVDFSKKLGVCSGCLYVGLALGPTIFNFAYDTTGTYHAMLVVIAVLAVVMAVVFIRFLRRAY